LGSTAAILEASAQKLNLRHPGVAIGTHAPPFGDLEGEETENMIEAVNAFIEKRTAKLSVASLPGEALPQA